jgi:hypothetical protein
MTLHLTKFFRLPCGYDQIGGLTGGIGDQLQVGRSPVHSVDRFCVAHVIAVQKQLIPQSKPLVFPNDGAVDIGAIDRSRFFPRQIGREDGVLREWLSGVEDAFQALLLFQCCSIEQQTSPGPLGRAGALGLVVLRPGNAV